jgi:hypothetical protein
MEKQTDRFKRILAYSIGGIISLLYGLGCHALIGMKSETTEALFTMSWGFVFIFPFCLGVLTVYFADTEVRKSYAFQIFAPWVTSVASLVLTMIAGREGTICMIMALPVYIICSSIGGLATGVFFKVTNNPKMQMVSLSFLLLSPFIEANIEQGFPLPKEIRTVETRLVVNADKKTVWSKIARIPKITEPQNSFFYFMGFPKPVEATLSFEGVGGVREAKFEKGLMFLETITIWEPEERLTFIIQSTPELTPLTTLDPHVVVGGHFFDTLLGEYRLEDRGNNQTEIILLSKFRISTRFNFYANLWADFLMNDIQSNILNVIQMRTDR